MSVYRMVLILMFGCCLCFCCVGCAAKTVEEAFQHTYKKAGQEIVYQGAAAEKAFVLYKAPFDNGKLGIGAAVFDGSDADGWRFSAGNAMYQETALLIDQVGVTFDDHVRRHLIYGWLDNPEIHKVELKDKNDGIIPATIVETNWKRIFYGWVEMNELRVAAYDKNGRLLVEVPYRNRE